MEELKAELKAVKAALDKLKETTELLNKTFLTTKETALLLGVKPRTVRGYNDQGKLNGRKYYEKGQLFFPMLEVLAFQEKNLKHSAFFGG